MVEGVGLEPTNPMGADLQSAAFGQLRYPSTLTMKWCRPEDLNPQPTDYKSVALPVELGRHAIELMVEDAGFEPATPCL